jgi:SAM-dependent methyltransferase
VITGERVSTPEGGFNPTFQRHVAAYRLTGSLLGQGRILDLGCGTGHSYRELEPRVTVGVDLEPSVLTGQERETHVADMRRLPFPAACFGSVISVQSLEHVPDPESVLAEVVRVLQPGGRAVFVTPNRLTFSADGEVIDPYHYVEYDARDLTRLCRRFFGHVEILGLHGSDRYLGLVAAERQRLARLLALDPLGLRRLIPRLLRQRLYDWRLRRDRLDPQPGALDIRPEDFRLSAEGLETALDLVAVCDLASRT